MQGKNSKRYTSTINCFITIFKEEGFVGYYKGIVARLARVVPGQVN